MPKYEINNSGYYCPQLYSCFCIFANMLEIEQWVMQNNPHFFIEQLKTKAQSKTDLEQSIEDLKQAELELLTILKSNQAQSEKEII